MQKLVWLLVVTLLTTPGAYAQKFTKAFSSSSGKKTVEIYLENVDLVIDGNAGNEVLIESEGFKGIPDRAKGLRPLYNGATDNTGLGLEVTETNNTITIKKASSQDLHCQIKVPASAALKIQEVGWTSNDILIRGISGEIEVKSNGSDIRLENVTGPVVANSTSGDIDVIFSQVNQQQPTSISNISGSIDISMPAATKATLDLSSITGEIYTDLDVKMEGEKEGMRSLGGGRKILGTLNGGGVEISLRAISDNIYLRKK